jgi:hypothetical protein
LVSERFNVSKTTPQAKVLTPIPDDQLLDGLTGFRSDGLLIADAGQGSIFHLNMSYGEYYKAISLLSLVPAGGQSVKVGADWVKALDNHIYPTAPAARATDGFP